MTQKKFNRGFTLIELLVTLAIFGIALALIYSIIIRSQKSYSTQEEITKLQELARTALSIMSKEIKLAGYNPTGTFTDATGNALEGFEYAATSPVQSDGKILVINSDLDASSIVGDSSNEIVKYYLVQESNGLYTLKRATNNGSPQPFIQNIKSMDITYHLYDSESKTYTDISTTGTELSSTQRNDIYSMSIALTLRTTNKVQDINDYIERTIKTDITIKQVESVSCKSAPNDPTNVSASDHPCDDGSALDVTWDPSTSSNITGYEVHVYETASSTEVRTEYTNASTTEAEVDGLTAGTNYTVTVMAVCGDYKSSGASGSGTPVADTPSPANTSTATVKWCPQNTRAQVYLDWLASSDDDGDPTKSFKYHILKLTGATSAEITGSPISGTGSSSYSHNYEETDPSAATYQIYTEWLCGTSTLTSSASDFNPSPVNFNSFIIPAPTITLNQTSTDAEISWTEGEIYSGVKLSGVSGCVVGHKIYRCTVPVTVPACIPNPVTDYVEDTYMPAPYTDPLPSAGNKNCYSIKTMTDSSNPSVASGMSNVVCTSSMTCPTVTISSPTDGSSVSGTVTVQASVTNSPTSVQLEVLQAGSSVAGPFTMTSSGGYYTYDIDTTTLSNGTYTLKVTASKAGCSDYSTSITVQVNNAVSSTCPFEIKEFKLDGDKVEMKVKSSSTDYTVYGMKFNWDGGGTNKVKKIEIQGEASGATWDKIWEADPGKSSPKAGICPADKLSSGDCARTEDQFQNGSTTEDVAIITSDYRKFKITFDKNPFTGTNFYFSIYDTAFSSCGSSCPTPTCDTDIICPFDYQNYSVSGKTVTFEIEATDTAQTIKGLTFNWKNDGGNKIRSISINGTTVWDKDLTAGTCPSGEASHNQCIDIDDYTLSPSDGWVTVTITLKNNFGGDKPEVKIYLTDPDCSACNSPGPDCIKKKF